MARPKYPSDYRRWFKLKVDILDNPKLQDCSADAFRFYIRLLAMLKKSQSRDGKIKLSRPAIRMCAGRTQLRHAETILRELAHYSLITLSSLSHHSSITPSSLPEQCSITVRNWAEYQEVTTDSKSKSKREEGRGKTGPTTPGVIEEAEPKKPPEKPPTLTDKNIADMIALKPNGALYSRADVVAWFAWVVPKMRLRDVRNFRAAATRNWWPRIKPGEVAEARKWGVDVLARAKGAEIQARMDATPQPTEFTPEQIKEATRALQ